MRVASRTCREQRKKANLFPEWLVSLVQPLQHFLPSGQLWSLRPFPAIWTDSSFFYFVETDSRCRSWPSLQRLQRLEWEQPSPSPPLHLSPLVPGVQFNSHWSSLVTHQSLINHHEKALCRVVWGDSHLMANFSFERLFIIGSTGCRATLFL